MTNKCIKCVDYKKRSKFAALNNYVCIFKHVCEYIIKNCYSIFSDGVKSFKSQSTYPSIKKWMELDLATVDTFNTQNVAKRRQYNRGDVQ